MSWLFERRTTRYVTSLSVTSDAEAKRAERALKVRPAAVIPTAIPVNPSDNITYDVTSKVVLWLGSLDYRANVDGLLRFLDGGVPTLDLHGFTLRVVGSGTNSELARKIRETPGATLVGFVPDLSTEASTCRAGVVPLWIGAGIKLKTLTMMDLGLPLFSTTVGAEGLQTESFAQVCDTPEDLAEAIVTASRNQLYESRRRAFDEIQQKFSEKAFEEVLTSFLRVIEKR